jgi:hypothetical protein
MTTGQQNVLESRIVPIAVPPLRERAADIPLLVEYLAGRYARTAGMISLSLCSLARRASFRRLISCRALSRAVVLCTCSVPFVGMLALDRSFGENTAVVGFIIDLAGHASSQRSRTGYRLSAKLSFGFL